MIYPIVRQMRKQLAQIDHWFDLATEHATARNFKPDVYLAMRLAPDQFAFARQVQTACDTAKFAAARLTGKEAPPHPDTEQSLDELRVRVRSVIAWLDSVEESAFEGAATRSLSLPRWEGKSMSGSDYLLEHALPNFYFHLTHVYALLRHAGVNVGKRDFLGTLSLRDPS